MKSHSVHDARANMAKLVEKALAGEPQRITRYGKDAVVLVSEQEWQARRPSKATLGSLLAVYGRRTALRSSDFRRPFAQDRPLGSDFE